MFQQMLELLRRPHVAHETLPQYGPYLPTYKGEAEDGTLSSTRATPTMYRVVPPTPCMT